MKFAPERLEVAVGDSVTFTNRDLGPHTVTSKAAGVESGELAPNQSWKLVVRQKGEIDYVCRLHPTMRGALVVK